jgi:hypothetical protein
MVPPALWSYLGTEWVPLPALPQPSEYTHKKKIGRRVGFDPEIVSL